MTTSFLRNIVLSLFVLVIVLPRIAPADPKPDPTLASTSDKEGLPRVLIIGDSISMGYTPATRRLLEGKANLQRIPVNGGSTTRGLQNIDAWLGQGHWDVIHFNWGLHDLYRDGQAHRVPIEQYEQNLRKLVERLEKTGAKLIWASTTPVPDGAKGRQRGDEVKYNAVAKQIMDKHQIKINDLYQFILPDLGGRQGKADVHFKPEGSEALAKEVAAHIERALESKPASR